jgi:hypothetical protein
LSDAVTLRGLTIKGIGFGGGRGVVFNTGKSLNVENCTIRNLDGSGHGILFTSLTHAALAVTNTVITDNSGNGITIVPSGAVDVKGVLDHVGLYNNQGAGLWVNGDLSTGATSITVTDSVASNNGGVGFLSSSGTATTRIMLQRSAAVANGTGVMAEGVKAQVIVNASVVFNNVHGWVADGGAHIFSYQNNAVSFNGSDEGPMDVFTPR